jgi:hypothetical protein
MSQQTIEATLAALAEYSGNFTDVAAAARHAASYCQLDANGKTVPIDARSSLTTVLQRIAAEHPEVVRAAPPKGNMVTDPAVLRLMAEDANEQKSLATLRGLYGKGSNGKKANALMKSDPSEYRRLRGIAVAAGLL